MKLLIDAGNTRIKWALVRGDEWLRSGTLPVKLASELSSQVADGPESHDPATVSGQTMAGGFAGAGLRGISQIWASNVAGAEVARQIRELGIEQMHIITAQTHQCGVRNGYANAAQLGSDRWAALIAAWHQVRGKCLVVSCGTATTIDALSAQGEFLGGLILPGVDLMQRSLAGATDKLKTGRGVYRGVYMPFPQNTADALFSGAVQASCGAIERQRALLDDDGVPVMLSGGAAGILQPYLGGPTLGMDNLVLRGLLLIAQEAGAR